MTGKAGIFAIILFFALPFAATAQEFRIINPIAAPGVRAPLPAGAVAVAQPRQIDRQQLDGAVRDLAAKWNTPALEAKLSSTFYDKSRLNDVMNTGVPRDAKLRVMAVQGVQILDQHLLPDPSGIFDTYVSRVSATVRTQVEYTSNTGTFQRLDGTNEFILKVTQRILR